MKTPYLLPELKKSKKSGWRVEYYVNGKRKIIRVEKIRKWHKNATDAEKMIKETIIKPLIIKLLSLSVVSETSTDNDNTGLDFSDILGIEKGNQKKEGLYLKEISANFKNSNYNTYQQYISYTNTFTKYIQTTNQLYTKIKKWKLKEINAYIKYLQDKKLSNQSINQHINYIKRLFSWCCENEYIEKNPAENVKKLKNIETKERKILSIEEMRKIGNYLKHNDYNFYVFTQIVYSCLIRPIEIYRLQIKDIDFENKRINISGTKSKNHKYRSIIIPNDLWDNTLDFWTKLKKYDKECYIFTEDNVPSKTKVTYSNLASIKWKKMREELHLSADCQLYCLKHTSITNLLNTLPENTIRMHARHENIQMTAHYGKHINEEMQEDMRTKISIY
jgi:integrase